MNIHRHFTTTARTLKWARHYDQSKHPIVKGTPKGLKWMWRTPDPPAYPKTLEMKLQDGSMFHQFIHKKALYEYVDENTLPQSLVEKTLPPLIRKRGKQVL